jgi:hypothetical protein
MLFIASSLALFIIYAGVKLLAQTRTDLPGRIFKYASWFFIVMGFLMLFCIGGKVAMHCYYSGGMMQGKCCGHSAMGKHEMSSCGMNDHQPEMKGCCGKEKKECKMDNEHQQIEETVTIDSTVHQQ